MRSNYRTAVLDVPIEPFVPDEAELAAVAFLAPWSPADQAQHQPWWPPATQALDNWRSGSLTRDRSRSRSPTCDRSSSMTSAWARMISACSTTRADSS